MTDPQQGLIVLTPDNKVVTLCYPATPSPECPRWYCSDGWAYDVASLLFPIPGPDPRVLQEQHANEDAVVHILEYLAYERQQGRQP